MINNDHDIITTPEEKVRKKIGEGSRRKIAMKMKNTSLFIATKPS